MPKIERPSTRTLDCDPDSIAAAVTDTGLSSKKPKQQDKIDEDNDLVHTLLRLCIADPDTRDDDDKIVKRLEEMSGKKAAGKIKKKP
jgi:hypothetical protein